MESIQGHRKGIGLKDAKRKSDLKNSIQKGRGQTRADKSDEYERTSREAVSDNNNESEQDEEVIDERFCPDKRADNK